MCRVKTFTQAPLIHVPVPTFSACMYTYEHDKYAKPPDQTTYHPQVTFPLCHMEGISQHGMQP